MPDEAYCGGESRGASASILATPAHSIAAEAALNTETVFQATSGRGMYPTYRALTAGCGSRPVPMVLPAHRLEKDASV
jgi:hypothetical protein